MGLPHPRLFSFPDYLFYRLAHWLRKGDAGGSRAGMLVSAMYTAVFSTGAIYVLQAAQGPQWVMHHLNVPLVLCLAFWVLIVLFNFGRYRNSAPALAARWGQDHPRVAATKASFALGGLLLIFYGSYQILHALFS